MVECTKFNLGFNLAVVLALKHLELQWLFFFFRQINQQIDKN